MEWGQFQKLRESIEKFGIVDPLIVNAYGPRQNIVIGGNMRLEVLKCLGYDDVPACYSNLDSSMIA